jgi:hypothetical protein
MIHIDDNLKLYLNLTVYLNENKIQFNILTQIYILTFFS